MENWMHCNKCGLRVKSKIKWFLTNCGHIFCEICSVHMVDSKCHICNQRADVIEMNKQMDSNVQQFFMPFEMFLKKSIEKVEKVYNFQTAQQNRLIQILSQKYDYAKKECIKHITKNKELTLENKILKENRSGNISNPFSCSTPALTNDNMQHDNLSDISSIPIIRNIGGLKITPGYATQIHTRPEYQAKIPVNCTPRQLYHAGYKFTPSQSQIASSGRKLVPVHRSIPGPLSSMRNSLGKRT